MLPLCSVCKDCAASYRCPACDTRTCSLACVQRHKDKTKCTGKRPRTKFVGLQDFNDSQLLSDFRFLEDGKSLVDSAVRQRPRRRGLVWPKRMKLLISEAHKRNIGLRFMPLGMQRHHRNQTWYDYHHRRIFWDIVWHFPAAGESVSDSRVDEAMCLGEVLKSHLIFEAGKAVQHHKLKPYSVAGLEGLRILMRREKSQANKVEYYELDTTSTLCDQLAGKTITEFPTFIVVSQEEAMSYNIHTVEALEKEQEHGA